MGKLGYKIWFIIALSILGLLLCSPQNAYAESKTSGRMYQYIYGHAYGNDLEFSLMIEKGEKRSEYMIPQFRYLKGVDGYSIYSLFTNDEFVDKYNKDFVKERNSYSMEAVAADSTIVQIINNGRGSYSVKGLKEGQTVIRFYETLLGVRRYLGCRRVIVGLGDCKEETVIIFVGSRLRMPSNWISVSNVVDANGATLSPVPKDKALFTEVKESKDYSYYNAKKTGETTATITIEKQKRTFKVKIVEPAVSKNAKKEYTIYEGYRVALDPTFDYFDDLFDAYLEGDQITGVSKNPEIVGISNKISTNLLCFDAKKPGKAKIDLYYNLGGKSKYLGQVVIKVLAANHTDYINRLAVKNTDNSENVTEEAAEVIETTDDDFIRITEGWQLNVRAGDNYQFHATSSRDFKIKWSVSDEELATINADTGAFKALKAGSLTVYASALDLFSTCYVNIVEKDAIIIEGADVIVGESFVTYTADYDNVTWRISDPTKADINVAGNKVTLFPKAVGTVILYAESGANRGQIEIAIEEVGTDYDYYYYDELYEEDYEDYYDNLEYYEY
jgi:hypothetical protein